MSGNVADFTVRPTRQNDPTSRRPGVLPDRRETRAPALESFARMGTASRGDVGGAAELMRTLGMVSKAADGFQQYAEGKFQQDEEALAGRAATDQLTGHVDPQLVERSKAYRNAIELGREQANMPETVRTIGEEVGQLVERQTNSDPAERHREADEQIDRLFASYLTDPETGELKQGLTSSVAMRWLLGAVQENKARLSGLAHTRINERMDGEALSQAGVLAGHQLAEGRLDVPALRAVLPASVTDDQLRGTILTTVAGTAEQLKANNRGADALRMLDQVLGTQHVPEAVSAFSATPSVGSAVAPAVTASSVAKRRGRSEGIGFVLNDLEGGAKVVDNRDGGGTTKFGITKRNNPDVDVANLTFEQAKRIAESRYWQSAYNKAHPAVALIAFDAGFINSKSFGREIATKYATDPVGALAAYRSRLQDIATKPDKARFLQAWMNRVERLGTYLGVGPGGQGSDNVISDPGFALDPEPLDPVEDARRNPGTSFAPLLTGGLALRPEERTRLMEYRDQLGREVRQEWTRERREKQDEAHAGFMLRLSGLGASTTPSEISAATRDGTIRPEDAVQLLNVIRADADRDEQRAERAAAMADRNRDKAEERQAEGIVSSLMGPVYLGTRAPGEALRLFGTQAARLDPRVRRAVLGAINAEANGVEALRKSNPEFVTAIDRLDDQEQQALNLIREPSRDPKTGRIMSAESRRELVRLEFAKAKRSLARQAVDTGDVGTLAAKLDVDLARKVRPYLIRGPRGKPADAPPSLSAVAKYYWDR